MMKLFLSQPAMSSAIGDGVSTHLLVLNQGQFSPIQLTDSPYSLNNIEGEMKMLGEIHFPLREFPSDLPAEHRSRNNQLLWHTLAQIEPQIEQAIARFGASRVAVVIGTSTTGVDENIPVFKYAAEHNDWSGEPFWQQQQYFSAPADFVAYQYGVQNLSYGISTACTSGARALISAARLLKANLCDAVICGGVDTLSPLTISGFSSLDVLSSQRTNPLSANRNGINIGEAAAVFIMSREPLTAQTVELLGYGSSSDAYHMSSPHPEGRGAIEAFEQALASAKLAPSEIGWINLHGTGTIHNDQMESLAVAKVFGDKTACTTTKPYTGHTLGAAGALEAAILWAVINRETNPTGILPPQLWDGVRDDHLPKIAITDTTSSWQAERRIGASSSFAFGGNNAVLILGEVC
ncbi:beta-ketoacyl-ACP synthase [Conservatibacter flavescens]|uniref:Beta-ketoacyl-[acyl-carrier-protein] synthase II n=1 Tax=Conservatibacter flavescens TaxID=28161 RepID=A0A2M8RZP4_9PAST|nr:beta-ketoacyl-ACP synthase [Conservatibacter flavescens]PJG84355.1 beta-ketoacyl-[acyl-carrier-protein] synthase II [Conservatibacter flavescens]